MTDAHFCRTLLLLLTVTASKFYPALAEKCLCHPPIIVGGTTVVPSRIICKNLSEMPRDFFSKLENRRDCQKSLQSATELTLEGVSGSISLSPSVFDVVASKLILKKIVIKDLCLQSIAPNFFGDFLRPSSLTAISFLNVRCLTAIEPKSFVNLKKLNTFRWVGGNLREIQPGAFSGMQALEDFMVKDTQLQVLPARLFSDRTAIVDLTLSGNQIETVPATFFYFEAKKLKLDLSQNKIRQLHDGLFEKIQLDSLDLQGNRLSSFTVAVLGAANQKSVSKIKLSDNALSKLSRNLVVGRTIDQFSLFVDGNPWHCACDLRWFSHFFAEDNANIVCASPPAVKGRKAYTLSDYDFCPTTQASQQPNILMGGGGGISRSKEPAYNTVTQPPLKGASVGGGGGPSKEELIAIGTSVAVIIVALVCFFLIYRYRGRLCKSKEKTQKQEYQPANRDEGYDGEPPVRTYVV